MFETKVIRTLKLPTLFLKILNGCFIFNQDPNVEFREHYDEEGEYTHEYIQQNYS